MGIIDTLIRFGRKKPPPRCLPKMQLVFIFLTQKSGLSLRPSAIISPKALLKYTLVGAQTQYKGFSRTQPRQIFSYVLQFILLRTQVCFLRSMQSVKHWARRLHYLIFMFDFRAIHRVDYFASFLNIKKYENYIFPKKWRHEIAQPYWIRDKIKTSFHLLLKIVVFFNKYFCFVFGRSIIIVKIGRKTSIFNRASYFSMRRKVTAWSTVRGRKSESLLQLS